MTYVILYRRHDSGKIYCVVSDNAYGIREFTTRQEASAYAERVGYMDESSVQIIEVPEA